MNPPASMARRDMFAAGATALALIALLFAWSPSLQPVLSFPHPIPPAITYSPPALTAGDHQEHYDEWNAVHSPALIALSAAILFPPTGAIQSDAAKPPLDPAPGPAIFPDQVPAERPDLAPILTPPRTMGLATPQHFAGAAPTRKLEAPAGGIELTGDWRDQSVDLAPVLALAQPEGAWSFTAVLRYDGAGRVQHVLLEAAALEPPLRDEIVRRLYQCRVAPGGLPGEGRLNAYGPGRTERP